MQAIVVNNNRIDDLLLNKSASLENFIYMETGDGENKLGDWTTP